MGKLVLVLRLAARDVRRHVAQAALLVVAIAAAAATLTMALALNGVTARPYAATRAATRGPDVVGYLRHAAQASQITHASGVASHSGPFPVASATIHVDGKSAGVFAEGRSQAPAGVDQPGVTAGGWVRPGGIVIERTFAEALGVRVGDRASLNGQSFVVVGIAVTAAQPPYPNLCYFTANACPPWFNAQGDGPRNLGVIWMTEPNATALASKANPLTLYAVNLKLTNPDQANAFADQHLAPPRAGPGPGPKHSNWFVMFSTWQGIASADALLVQDAQSVLEPGALLLALLAMASVAVLVGRRLSEFSRRVGLLKAVGGTPGFVAAAFLAENLALALFAAVVRLGAGWLAAPLLTDPGAALIGAGGAPSLSWATVVEVIGVAVIVALVASLVPSIRAARRSTVAALNDVARPPKRRGALIRISGRLPVPALFGLRLVARRPRRALLTSANITVTVTGIVAVLAFHVEVSAKLANGQASGMTAGGLADPVIRRDEQMLTVITIMLITLAVLNAIFTTWATVLDARRASALMRALGARVRQVSAGLVVAQVVSALPGAIVGVPLGILLFKAAVHGGDAPPAPWLAVAVLGTLLVMALLTIIPARIGARRAVTEALRAEAA
jgi:putative ABC transport system permease protein